MADIRTETDRLNIEMYFVDGDTRTITLKNPKMNIATSEIASLNTWLQDNNAIVGDKMGATFGKITKVTTITQTKIDLDLTT